MCLACNPGLMAVFKHTTSRRDFLKYMGGAAAAIFAATAVEPAMAKGNLSSANAPADIIFRRGTILTLNAERLGAKHRTSRQSLCVETASLQSARQTMSTSFAAKPHVSWNWMAER